MGTWKNYPQNVVITPRLTLSPETYGDVKAAIDKANAAKRRLRAVGRGWSFTEVTVSDDILLEMRSLRGLLGLSQNGTLWRHELTDVHNDPHVDPRPLSEIEPSWVLPVALAPAAKTMRLVHVLGGTSIREIYTALGDVGGDVSVPAGGAKRAPWTLRVMGGSSGQTIAGVLATATHGGDPRFGPIIESVRALHLVGPDGKEYWIERKSARITDEAVLSAQWQAQLKRKLPVERILVNDDETFDAVAVGFGSFGVLYSVVLEVTDRYGISEIVHTDPATWDGVRSWVTDAALTGNAAPPWLASHLAAPGQPAPNDAAACGVGVFINPYRIGDNYGPSATQADRDRSVVVVTQAASVQAVTAARPARSAGSCLLEQFATIVGFEAADSLRATRQVVNQIIAGLRGGAPVVGYPLSTSVLDTTSDPNTLVQSVEISVPTKGDRHLQLMGAILLDFDQIITKYWNAGVRAKFAGGFNMRFAKSSTAHLAMQYSEDANALFCHVEIILLKELDALGTQRGGPEELENYTEDFVRAFERRVRQFDARLHWGQWSILRAHDPERYPKLDTWRRVRRQFTNDGALQTFDNRFTARYGLVEVPPDWKLVRSLAPATERDGSLVSGERAERCAPVVARNPASGALETFVAAADGQVCRLRGARWEKIPETSRFLPEISVALGSACSYVFAIGAQGIAYQTNWSTNDTRAWTRGWSGFGSLPGGGAVRALAGSCDAKEGWPFLFAADPSGKLFFVTLTRDITRRHGHFGDWEDPGLSLAPGSRPSVVGRQIGVASHIEVLVRQKGANVLAHAHALVNGNGSLTPGALQPVPGGPGPIAGDPIAVVDGSTLHVFVVLANGGALEHVSHDGNAWSGWTAVPNATIAAGDQFDAAAGGGSVAVVIGSSNGIRMAQGAAGAWKAQALANAGGRKIVRGGIAVTRDGASWLVTGRLAHDALAVRTP